MKKLVYLAVVAFAASMVACGNSNKANEEAPAVVEEAAAEVVVDSAAQDTAVVLEATEAVAE